MRIQTIQAIERVLDKRSSKGASDNSLVSWLEHLKKIHKNNEGISTINEFISAIKQTPLLKGES